MELEKKMVEQALRKCLEEHFDPISLQIKNESHLHERHMQSPLSGESHFHVELVSEKFKGLSRIEQQRLVMDVCTPLFAKGLHALRLKTTAP